MPEKRYPYQNRSLTNIKGEIWKNIPDLEGYFMISNYGRVKRLPYELPFEDGRVYQIKPMIMKPTLNLGPNYYKQDHTYFLRITLTLAKRIYNFSIARMVYYCFIQRFDWDDEDLLVIYRDRNGKNIRFSNLRLVTRHERQLIIIKGHRQENVLLRPEIRAKNHIAIRENLGVEISQYDDRGNRLMTYPAVPAAAAAVGTSTGNISGVLRGRKVTAAGYFWRYGKKKKIDIHTFLEERKASNQNFIGKQVSQYSLKGKRIAIYRSINEAARKTGAESVAIGRVVNGKAKSAGSYFWMKGEGKEKINLSKLR